MTAQHPSEIRHCERRGVRCYEAVFDCRAFDNARPPKRLSEWVSVLNLGSGRGLNRILSTRRGSTGRAAGQAAGGPIEGDRVILQPGLVVTLPAAGDA